MGADADLRDFEKAVATLEEIRRKSIPYAARRGINDIAFNLQREWQGQIKRAFVLRNKFTERSIHVRKASGTNVDTMKARVGSTASYMRDQEFGNTEQKKGKHGVPVPTSVASGEGRGANPRRKVVRRGNRMNQVSLQPRVSGGPRQKIAAAFSIARRGGSRYAFLSFSARTRGIFRIRGSGKRMSLDMIYDLSRPIVRTAPEPTLQRSLAIVDGRAPRILADAVRKQIRWLLRSRS